MPNGTLASALRAEEQELNTVSRRRVKVVEKNGSQLQELLTKGDSRGTETCSRRDYMVCLASEDGTTMCRQENIVYSSTCQACKVKGKTTQYAGKPSRSMYE